MLESKNMIKAAKSGDAARVTALLDIDITLLSARDSDGSTPLHCATWKGHADVVELLLQRGADHTILNDNTHWGGTPLHAAAHGNQKEAAEVLIRHGADVNAVNQNGRTPLAETAIHKATAVARLLRENGAIE